MANAERDAHEQFAVGADPQVSFARLPSTAGLCVLVIRGELDVSTSKALRRELVDALDSGVQCVDLDLSGVAFMDSSALGVLVDARRHAGERAQQVRLLAPSPACAKVLEITGLDRLFDVL